MSDPTYPAMPTTRTGAYQQERAAKNAAMQASNPNNIPAFAHGDKASFRDLVDIVNPLQHIPGVNYLYRKITGDQEGAVADVVGGALWGGPIGVASAMADLTTRSATGQSIGDNMVALVTGKHSGTQSDTAVADSGQVNSAQLAANMQPASATPPPAPTPVAMPAVTVASAGPAHAGDYMVFGGQPIPASGSSGIRSLFTTPLGAGAQDATPAVATSDQSVASAGQSAVTPISTQVSTGNSRGNFMTFGANGPASTTLPGPNGAGSASPVITMNPLRSPAANPQSQGALSQGPQTASPQTMAMSAPSSAATASASVTANAAAALPSGFHPLPGRTGPSHPPNSLPPPTTGPGALPGGKSQAISPAQIAAYQNSTNAATPAPTPTSATAPSQTWFVSQFNAAMDKYQRAAVPGISGAQPQTPNADDPAISSSVFAMPGVMAPQASPAAY